MSWATAGRCNRVHVMDREADVYSLFAGLIEHEARFVVRTFHDRLLAANEKQSTIQEKLERKGCESKTSCRANQTSCQLCHVRVHRVCSATVRVACPRQATKTRRCSAWLMVCPRLVNRQLTRFGRRDFARREHAAVSRFRPRFGRSWNQGLATVSTSCVCIATRPPPSSRKQCVLGRSRSGGTCSMSSLNATDGSVLTASDVLGGFELLDELVRDIYAPEQ